MNTHQITIAGRRGSSLLVALVLAGSLAPLASAADKAAEIVKPAAEAPKVAPAKITPIKSAALRKEEAATQALRRAERAAAAGGTAAQADLLEARVAVRLARQEVNDEKFASAAPAPETEATRQQLWTEIAAARTPAERREATARYAEYQRLVHEQKTATTRTEDKK